MALIEYKDTDICEEISFLRSSVIQYLLCFSLNGKCIKARPVSTFFADTSMLPPELQNIFDRVRASADFMPTYQMEVRQGNSIFGGEYISGALKLTKELFISMLCNSF